jgi:4-hydroxy-3-polyprenylbenzoate decarboxylase
MAAELLKKKKIAIGISGASGAVYGIRLLEELARAGVETHLSISRWGEYTIEKETAYTPAAVKALAAFWYEPDDLAASLSSGSYPIDAMAICPCSMKTLAGVAMGFSEDLLMRAADVCLKERRPLILAVRETPLSRVHIENMLKATDAGAIIMPPVPAFYMQPETLEDVVTQSVYRIMDKLGVPAADAKHWGAAD